MTPLSIEAIPAFLSRPDRPASPLLLPLTRSVVAIGGLALTAAGASLFLAGLVTGLNLGLTITVPVAGAIPAPAPPVIVRPVTPPVVTQPVIVLPVPEPQAEIPSLPAIIDEPAIVLPVLPLPKPVPPPGPQPATKATPTWTVQAGAFREQANADDMTLRLDALGYAAIRHTAPGGLIMVLVPNLPDRAEARAVMARLKTENIPALIRLGS